MAKKEYLLETRANLVKKRLAAVLQGKHTEALKLRKQIKVIDKLIKNS